MNVIHQTFGKTVCLAHKNISDLAGWDELLKKWHIKANEISAVDLKQNNITVLPKVMFLGLTGLKRVYLQGNPGLPNHFDDGSTFADCSISKLFKM